MLRLLFVGDIVGASGRRIIKDRLSDIIKSESIDVVIANAENVAGGLGITGSLAKHLFSCGINVITLGNHVWSKKDMIHSIENQKNIARPANISNDWPGNDYCIYDYNGFKIAVINLLGRVGMGMLANCPFEKCDDLVTEIKQKYNPNIIVVDFHAEATAEKQAFARYFDGRVSLVVGTHTHVQTADETILESGTGYITDVGMTGPINSIIGMNVESSINRFIKKLPVPYLVADGEATICGIVAKIDENKGKTLSIKRINYN